jgi:hypothetical protein
VVNFLAQCEGIDAIENYGAQRYLTTQGILDVNKSVTVQAYANWNMPISQFHGAFTQTGGSIYNFRPIAPSSWTATYYPGGYFMRDVTGDAGLDTVVQFAACKFGDVSKVGGNMIYLGGHSYDGTSLSNVNGMRVLLNSLFIPAKRLIGEGLVSPNHSVCQGDTISIQFYTAKYRIYLRMDRPERIFLYSGRPFHCRCRSRKGRHLLCGDYRRRGM